MAIEKKEATKKEVKKSEPASAVQKYLAPFDEMERMFTAEVFRAIVAAAPQIPRLD